MDRMHATNGPLTEAATAPFSQKIAAQFVYLSQRAHPIVVAAIVDRFIAEKLLLPEHRNHVVIQSVLELSKRRFGSSANLTNFENHSEVLQSLSVQLQELQVANGIEVNSTSATAGQGKVNTAASEVAGSSVKSLSPASSGSLLSGTAGSSSGALLEQNIAAQAQSVLDQALKHEDSNADIAQSSEAAVSYSLWSSGLFPANGLGTSVPTQPNHAPLPSTSSAHNLLLPVSSAQDIVSTSRAQQPQTSSAAASSLSAVGKNSIVPDSVRSLWSDGLPPSTNNFSIPASSAIIPTSCTASAAAEVICPSLDIPTSRVGQAEILVQPPSMGHSSAPSRSASVSSELGQLLPAQFLPNGTSGSMSVAPASSGAELRLMTNSSGLLQLAAPSTLLQVSQAEVTNTPNHTRDLNALKTFTLSSRFRWCQVFELQPGLMYKPEDLDQFVIQTGKMGFAGSQLSPALELLNSLFVEWCDQAAVSQEFQASVQAATQELNIMLQEINLSVQLVGSAACGVALKEHSQVDWALMPLEGDTSTTYAKVLAFQAAQDLLLAKGILRADSAFVSSIRTAVPGIKFVHPKLNVTCNLFIAGAEPAARTQLMAFISGANPKVVAVLRLIKMWSKRMNLNNPAGGTLSSWCWFLLFMYHLQQHRKAPLVPFKQVFGEGIGGDASIAGRMKEGKLTTRDLEILQQSVGQLQHRLASELDDSVAELLISFFCHCSLMACTWRSSGGGISTWHAAALPEDRVSSHMPIFVEDPLDLHANAAVGVKPDIAHLLGNETYVAAQALLKVKTDTQAVQCLADLFDLRSATTSGVPGPRRWTTLI